MWKLRTKYQSGKTGLFLRTKNYIALDKICISPSMCLENDYIRVVLRDY